MLHSKNCSGLSVYAVDSRGYGDRLRFTLHKLLIRHLIIDKNFGTGRGWGGEVTRMKNQYFVLWRGCCRDIAICRVK